MNALHSTVVPLVYMVAAAAVILGLRLMPRVRTARPGLLLAAAGVVLALAITVADASPGRLGRVGAGALVGAVLGIALALRAGAARRGGATLAGAASWAGLAAAAAGLLGMALLRQQLAAPSDGTGTPGVLAGVLAFAAVLAGFAGVAVALLGVPAAARGRAQAAPLAALATSGAGLAEAALGFLVGNAMLIVAGGLLATLGLTMARQLAAGLGLSLGELLLARGRRAGPASTPVRTCDTEEAALALEGARRVAIVPGYGMAVAQAQHAVQELAELLVQQGAEVRFVVHPWAGRIPGHINILLDEVNVPHEQLHDPGASAAFLAAADVVVTVGANDVVNPAAADLRGPLGGMPRLDLSRAGVVLVIDRGAAPGFTGYPNALFVQPNAMLLQGDAKRMTQGLVAELKPRHA